MQPPALTHAHQHLPVAPAANDELAVRLKMALSGANGPTALNVEIRIARGETLAVLGTSGSGKTTLLRLIAGLETPDEGCITAFGCSWLDSARGINLPPRKRRPGMVFQDYALFPHMTVRGNLLFALPRRTPHARADELIEMIGLQALADHRPGRLSGGQQQRLALARALAAAPNLLLLDEPLSALDGGTRREMQDTLLTLRATHPVTTLIVTHDPAEALRLADRAIVMDSGRIVADGPPAKLLSRPYRLYAPYRPHHISRK